MGLTKSVEAVDAWAELVHPGVREGATVDISGNYETILHIDMCLSEAVAETAGATAFVEISSNDSGDADWTVFARLAGPTGTAESEALASDEAAGQTVLSVNNPTTNNLDNPARFIFFEDTGTPANSEIVFQVSNEGDTTDTITILDGLTNAKAAASSLMWFVDSATLHSNAVVQYSVTLPLSAKRVRVIYDSTHATAADIYTRCRLSKVTAI